MISERSRTRTRAHSDRYAPATILLVGISPARVFSVLSGPRRRRTLTQVHVSDGWVYATTGRTTTYLWNRDEAFFDVDIERRVISIASGVEEVSFSARFFSLRQLRELHSIL